MMIVMMIMLWMMTTLPRTLCGMVFMSKPVDMEYRWKGRYSFKGNSSIDNDSDDDDVMDDENDDDDDTSSDSLWSPAKQGSC